MKSTVILTLSLASILTACGNQDQTAMVTLLTGFESNPTQNLMVSLTDQMNSKMTVSPFCLQTQVTAALSVKKSNGGQGEFIKFPVNLSTSLGSQINQADPAGWLKNNSSLKPITLPAPIGQPLDFGILGALIDASQIGGNEGEPCKALDSSSNPNPTISMIGHAQATISGKTVIPINTWLLNPNTKPVAPSAACQSSSNIGNGGALDQACASRNFYFGKVTGDLSNVNAFKFEYAIDSGPSISQVFSKTNVAAGVSIPAINPIKVTAFDGSTAIGSTQLIRGNNDEFNGVFKASITDTSGNNIDLTFVEQGGVGTMGPVKVKLKQIPNTNTYWVSLNAYLATEFDAKYYDPNNNDCDVNYSAPYTLPQTNPIITANSGENRCIIVTPKVFSIPGPAMVQKFSF
jgi:hypothetical protein